VIGVEGAEWSETLPTLADAEYLMLPRLMAIAELGWSPAADRSGPASPAFEDFTQRVAAQGARLQAEGLDFYTTTEVPWTLAGTGGDAVTAASGKVTGSIGTLSAPGLTPGDLTATITVTATNEQSTTFTATL
jgi:N-acetyl-beta-hexosaminidase